MDKKDYIRTLHINGNDIDLGIDDYGQCYYIEYKDEDGNLQEVGLGSYNLYYMYDIYAMFDPRYNELSRKEASYSLTPKEQKELDKYNKKIQQESLNC